MNILKISKVVYCLCYTMINTFSKLVFICEFPYLELAPYAVLFHLLTVFNIIYISKQTAHKAAT